MNKTRGFTLTELIIAIVVGTIVLGIAAITIAMVINMAGTSRTELTENSDWIVANTYIHDRIRSSAYCNIENSGNTLRLYDSSGNDPTGIFDNAATSRFATPHLIIRDGDPATDFPDDIVEEFEAVSATFSNADTGGGSYYITEVVVNFATPFANVAYVSCRVDYAADTSAIIIGGPLNDAFAVSSILQTFDRRDGDDLTDPNGYLITGSTSSFVDGDSGDIYFIHLDDDGNYEWSRYFGSALLDRPIFTRQGFDVTVPDGYRVLWQGGLDARGNFSASYYQKYNSLWGTPGMEQETGGSWPTPDELNVYIAYTADAYDTISDTDLMGLGKWQTDYYDVFYEGLECVYNAGEAYEYTRTIDIYIIDEGANFGSHQWWWVSGYEWVAVPWPGQWGEGEGDIVYRIDHAYDYSQAPPASDGYIIYGQLKKMDDANGEPYIYGFILRLIWDGDLGEWSEKWSKSFTSYINIPNYSTRPYISGVAISRNKDGSYAMVESPPSFVEGLPGDPPIITRTDDYLVIIDDTNGDELSRKLLGTRDTETSRYAQQILKTDDDPASPTYNELIPDGYIVVGLADCRGVDGEGLVGINGGIVNEDSLFIMKLDINQNCPNAYNPTVIDDDPTPTDSDFKP